MAKPAMKKKARRPKKVAEATLDDAVIDVEAEPETRQIALPTARQVTANVRPLLPANVEEGMAFAKYLSKSGITPQSLPGQPGSETRDCATFAIIQMGATVGLPPMSSLGAFAIINGRIAMYGDGQLAVVIGQPDLVDLQEGFTRETGDENDETMTAICTVQRMLNGKVRTVQRPFSVKDAQRAQLWGKSGPWQTFPKRMLQLRARAFALRDSYSDVLLGFTHSVEELRDMTDAEFTVVGAPAMPTPEDYQGVESIAKADKGATGAVIAGESVSGDTTGATADVATGGPEPAQSAQGEPAADPDPVPDEQEETADDADNITFMDWQGEERHFASVEAAVLGIPALLKDAPSVAVIDGFWEDNAIDERLEDCSLEVVNEVNTKVDDIRNAIAGEATEESEEPDDLRAYRIEMPMKDGAKSETQWWSSVNARMKTYTELADYDKFETANVDIIDTLSAATAGSLIRMLANYRKRKTGKK